MPETCELRGDSRLSAAYGSRNLNLASVTRLWTVEFRVQGTPQHVQQPRRHPPAETRVPYASLAIFRICRCHSIVYGTNNQPISRGRVREDHTYQRGDYRKQAPRVCALHGVSPRDQCVAWSCVLPRWQSTVNVNVLDTPAPFLLLFDPVFVVSCGARVCVRVRVYRTLRPPRWVSMGPVAVRLAEMAF